MRRSVLFFTICICAARALPAQTAEQVTAAAATITAPNITRHINVIADDSMLGRDTPSPGLEKTAQYVADQFKALGLKPGGADGTWFDRYTVPSRADFARSHVVFTAAGKSMAASFTTAARLITDAVPERPESASVVLLAGRHTVPSLERAGVRNKIVVYVAPATSDTGWSNVVTWLIESNKGLVVLSSRDSTEFARQVQAARLHPAIRVGPGWAASVWPEGVAGLPEALAAADVDLARARRDSTPIVREMPSLQVSLDLRLDRPVGGSATAPNVLGTIAGSDPKLKDQYIIFTAHMDHSGVTSGQRPDSIPNGADDNASGTAGLIELARAFSQPGVRPRRSLAFVAVSGGAKDRWGSDNFAERLRSARELKDALGDVQGQLADMLGMVVVAGENQAGTRTQIDLQNMWPSGVVANITLDMIGGGARDSILVDGVRDIDLATSPTWVVTAHPELQLTLVDHGTAASPESDHFALTQRGVPSLYVHNGTHAAMPAAADAPSTVNTEQEARVLRLVFYIGRQIADADRQPRWTLEGRRQFLKRAAP